MHLLNLIHNISPLHKLVVAVGFLVFLLTYLLTQMTVEDFDVPEWLKWPLPGSLAALSMSLLLETENTVLIFSALSMGLLWLAIYDVDDLPLWWFTYSWNWLLGRQCDYFYCDQSTPGETCERAAGHKRGQHYYSGGSQKPFQPWWN